MANEYQPDFVRQTSKRKKSSEAADEESELPGRNAGPDDVKLMSFVQHLALSPGWHFQDGVGVHVANQAKSLRSPTPRFQVRDFSLRTSVGEFILKRGLPRWRILEERADLLDLPSHQLTWPLRATRLVTFFEPGMKAKKNTGDEKSSS